MSGVVLAMVIVVVVAVGVVAFLRHTSTHHPENSATHGPPDEPARPAVTPIGEQRYPGVDRPAGPDAESQVSSFGSGAPPDPASS